MELSFNCEIECEFCGSEVNYGDDYVCHLQIQHKMKHNFSGPLQRAREGIKKKISKRKADVITLDEGSDEEKDDDNVNDAVKSCGDTLDPNLKINLEMTVKKTMDELLFPIKELIDGTHNNTYEEVIDDNEVDPAEIDNQIWKSFNDLKNAVNNLKVSDTLIKSLVMSEEPVEEVKEKETTNTKQFKPHAKKQRETMKENTRAITITSNKRVPPRQTPTKPSTPVSTPTTRISNFKAPTPKQPQAKKQPTKPASATKTTSSASSSSVVSSQAPLTPTNQTPSKSALNSSTRSGSKSSTCKTTPSPASSTKQKTPSRTSKTMYRCPLNDCSFSTSRDGMEDGLAATHLRRDHKITPSQMKESTPGKFKFRKVKNEKKKV